MVTKTIRPGYLTLCSRIVADSLESVTDVLHIRKNVTSLTNVP